MSRADAPASLSGRDTTRVRGHREGQRSEHAASVAAAGGVAMFGQLLIVSTVARRPTTASSWRSGQESGHPDSRPLWLISRLPSLLSDSHVTQDSGHYHVPEMAQETIRSHYYFFSFFWLLRLR